MKFALWLTKLIYCLFISLAPPPKDARGSTARDFHVEFNFLGLGCNHALLEQIEAKNSQKEPRVIKNSHFRRFFSSGCFKSAWSHSRSNDVEERQKVVQPNYTMKVV